MPTCKKCSSHFPNRLIIDGKERSLQNRKFCLACSPFGLHNTKNLNNFDLNRNQVTKKCCECKNVKTTEEFYNYNKISAYCKVCYGIKTRERQKRFKEKCIEYKGGKCTSCGYNKCIAALEFHHRDPSTKKFSIVKAWTKGFKREVIEELEKCELLCANCHREAHYS